MLLEQEPAGGSPPPDFVVLETSDEFTPHQIPDAIRHIQLALDRGLPSLRMGKEHEGTLVICGGGHTIKDHLEDIRRKSQDPRFKIFAINDTYDWLHENGIVPWGFGMMEIASWPDTFVKRADKRTKFFIASMAHPISFNRLEGYDVTLWHAWGGIGEDKIVAERDPGAPLVCGGEGLSIRAINLGFALGFRDFEMYGVDGSYTGDTSHVYFDRKHPRQTIWWGGRLFPSAYYLARQADDLRRFCKNWHHIFKLRCYGDGLVQHVHRTCWPDQYQQE
jgi:hypothetical protein